VTKPEEVKLEIEESKDFFEYNLVVAPEDIGRTSNEKTPESN
jgi:predicted RNA-binding protein YlqC (UPF0109 family)